MVNILESFTRFDEPGVIPAIIKQGIFHRGIFTVHYPGQI
jgi:hypothetical protein